MEVKDRLPGRCAGRVQQVNAVGAEPGPGASGDLLGQRDARRQVLGANVMDVLGVRAGITSACPRVAGLMSISASAARSRR